MEILKAKRFIRFEWRSHPSFLECHLENFTCNVYFVVSPGGSITYQSEVWQQQQGYSVSELIAERPFDSLAPAITWAESELTARFIQQDTQP